MCSAQRINLLVLSAALTGVLPSLCLSEPKPLWELGIGPAFIVFSDYPGAPASHGYAVPFPYVRYRGKILHSDEEGLRGMLFEQPSVAVNISLGASVPVRSSEDSARGGMPNLDATFEVGPSLNFHLWHSRDSAVAVDFRLPARLAVTVDTRPRSVGWFMAPNINVDIHGPPELPGWKLGVLVGPIYSTRRYNDYYYSVAPEFETQQRAAYQAPGGYAGVEVVAALSRRFRTIWVGSFIRYRTLQGAVFAESPLVKRTDDLAAGIGVAWLVSRSSRQVNADD